MADLYAVIRKSILFVIDGTHCEILLYDTDFEALEKRGWICLGRLWFCDFNHYNKTLTIRSHIFGFEHHFFTDLIKNWTQLRYGWFMLKRANCKSSPFFPFIQNSFLKWAVLTMGNKGLNLLQSTKKGFKSYSIFYTLPTYYSIWSEIDQVLVHHIKLFHMKKKTLL